MFFLKFNQYKEKSNGDNSLNHDRCENLRSKMPDDLKNRQNVEIIFENLRL